MKCLEKYSHDYCNGTLIVGGMTDENRRDYNFTSEENVKVATKLYFTEKLHTIKELIVSLDKSSSTNFSKRDVKDWLDQRKEWLEKELRDRYDKGN